MSQPAPPRVVPMSRKDRPRARGLTANRRVDADEAVALIEGRGA